MHLCIYYLNLSCISQRFFVSMGMCTSTLIFQYYYSHKLISWPWETRIWPLGYADISRDTEACKHLIPFNVWFSCLCQCQSCFHGNTSNIPFTHVYGHISSRYIKMHINTLWVGILSCPRNVNVHVNAHSICLVCFLCLLQTRDAVRTSAVGTWRWMLTPSSHVTTTWTVSRVGLDWTSLCARQKSNQYLGM